MKSIIKINMMKATAFIAAVLFSIFCFTGCNPEEPVIPVKAVITIQAAENVGKDSATLVAMLTPNMNPTTVTFRYMVVGKGGRKSVSPIETYSGTESKKVTYKVFGLEAGAVYQVDAIATNAAGSVPSTLGTFTTAAYVIVKATAAITAISEVKIDSATIYFVSVPNQSNTTVSLEYQKENSTWQSKEMGTNFSGSDTIKLSWTLTGLQANTKYNVRTKSLNKAGEVISSILQFTTLAYTVKDWDGNVYHLVTIGTQTWLRENFKGTHFANGDAIANITDANTWIGMTTPSYCWYNNDSKLGQEYGGLYNKYTVFDSRDLIVGYHIPSGDEFEDLNTYLGGYSYSGIHIMEAGNTHWKNTTRAADNSSGFTALPNGYWNPYVVKFADLGQEGSIWTSTHMGLSVDNVDIVGSNCTFFQAFYSQNLGFGIRLLKN